MIKLLKTIGSVLFWLSWILAFGNVTFWDFL